MSNYSTLKAAIQSAVYTNNNNEITGAGLQAVLLQFVNTVGDGYVFAGVATAGTSPGTPDANVFYITPAGTYTNFGRSYTVPVGSIGVFYTYGSTWAFTSIKVVDEVYKEIALLGASSSYTTSYGSEILTKNGYINVNGTFQSHNTYRASEKIAIPEKPIRILGEFRTVKITTSTLLNGSVSSIAFYTAGGIFLYAEQVTSKVHGFDGSGRSATFLFGSDAAYFAVSTRTSDTNFSVTFDVSVGGIAMSAFDRLSGIVSKTSNELQKQVDSINVKEAAYLGLATAYSTTYNESILTVDNSFVSVNGGLTSNSSYVCSDLMPIPTRDTHLVGKRVVRLKSRVNLNNSLAALAWYDSGGNFISVAKSSSGLLTAYNYTKSFGAIYIIPDDAAYFRVSERKLSPYDFEIVFDVAVNGTLGLVTEMAGQLDIVRNMQKPSVWMPKHLYMLRGIQSQIFTAGIACAQNPEALHMNITYGSGMSSSNAKGYNRDRVFEWTPSAGDANQVYRFGYTHDFFGSVDAGNGTTLHNVAPKASPSSNKNILCIGDSFTDQNWWVSELNHLLTGHTDSLTDPNNTHGNDGLTNLTFIGTKDTDKTPNEGYSGKTYQWFCESESPFYYNGDVDFTAYCSAHGFSGIDIAIILLGTNGGNGEQYVKKIWDKLLEHNPNVKVLILGRCFAVPYGTGTAGMQYNQTWIKQSQGVQPQNAIFEGYTEEAGYSGNFLYVEYNALLDNANNMPWSSVNANDRNTDVKVRQATDNVHPSKYGYWQIADAVRGAFHYWCI